MAINTNILKTYAPEARRAFIAAVKARAARFGITEQGSSVIREEGNVAIINGRAYPRSFAQQRRDLDRKISIRGYAAVMEEVAYTWFNRFAAIRYMELHDYLDHGVRVLSHPNGGSIPEIVEKAAHVDLPGLKRDQVVALKLDGTKDEELYRLLIVAQCNALHAAMPFLFEKIDDETELLLPDNLLHSESLIRQMVERIPEADWQHIEIIGWLYQFYISEKKDQVIGEVVASEDIPAATQLFTPNWIVKYMIQNSLGAKWLATYPTSSLRGRMEYYIEPSEQPADVQIEIDAEIPETLDPETITFLDPASGSGHILVEAYNLFKEIYLERGYRLREIPRLILEKNIYGLDIDDRAAQLSGFALMMRARADDRHVLGSESPVKLNVLSIQESRGLDAEQLSASLVPALRRFDLVPTGDLLPETLSQPPLGIAGSVAAERKAISALLEIFADAKTFGSLITVPAHLAAALPSLGALLTLDRESDLETKAGREHAASVFAPFYQQAKILSRTFDIINSNPPYMGGRGMNDTLSNFLAANYSAGKGDLMTAFTMRSTTMLSPSGVLGSVTLDAWMFISSYEQFRRWLAANSSVSSLIHIGWNAFPTGHVYNRGVAFTLSRPGRSHQRGQYVDLSDVPATVDKRQFLLGNYSRPPHRYVRSSATFDNLPGAPFAFSLSDRVLGSFSAERSIGGYFFSDGLTKTGNNTKYLRFHWEVSRNEARNADVYRTCVKGGESRSFYGNTDVLVNWTPVARAHYRSDHVARISPEYLWGRAGISWTKVSSKGPTFRWFGDGMIAETGGPAIFLRDGVPDAVLWSALGYLNSKVSVSVLDRLNPTINVQTNDVLILPFDPDLMGESELATQEIVSISETDWNSRETSIGFATTPLLRRPSSLISARYQELVLEWEKEVEKVRALQTANDLTFAKALGLEGEIDVGSSTADVHLNCNPAYRYGVDRSKDWSDLLLADTIREFVSYAVGCMFGRFSVDAPGPILANPGETLPDYLAKIPDPTFMPDADNVIPVTDDVWFDDDITERFFEFLRTVFGEEQFADNLAFIEDALGQDTRRFFKREFYADHLRRYKKRPIYWLFSSGKERAFEALVYLHRYNEGTLARMRLEYVVPLQTQMAGRVQRLTDELNAGNLSSSETKKRNVQLEKLQKQQDELRRFEEELHHYADQRIKLDLDDGVKINYGKFGNLLADVKAITGGKDDE